MARQTLLLELKGLYVNNNPLSPTTAPPGTLKQALNCVITKQGVIESRRGFTNYSESIVGSDLQALFEFKDTKLAHSGSRLYSDDGNGTWTERASGISSPDSEHKINGIQANNNFYFTSSDGIKKLESVSGGVRQAGVPKALDGTASLTLSGATWFPFQTNVAYRAVLGYKDTNNNLLLSAPSQRLVVSNTDLSLDAFVTLDFNLPIGLNTDFFIQIYRSTVTNGINDEPNDELKLAVEQALTSTDIANRKVTIIDKTIETLLGVALYTNQSQEGLINQNDPPPFAKDICQYKNFTLYANTKSIGRVTFTFLGIGSTGFDVGDTVTIGGITYTGHTSNDSSLGRFKIETSGTPASNIQNTVLNFVNIVNSHSLNTTHYAFYSSSVDDLPGKVTVETRTVGTPALTITSSKGGVFQPTLTSPGIQTDDDESPNRIYISKPGQAESVPAYQFLPIGSRNFPIERIIALRDSVFIFKQDGIYSFQGENFSSFRATLFDNSTRLKGLQTAITFNNLIYAFSDQGVISISDSGLEVISGNTEQELIKLLANNNINKAFGVGYDSERSYILFVPEHSSDTYCNLAYVYNLFTDSFTKWRIGNVKCGLLDRSRNKLFFGTSLDQVLKERKSYSYDDFFDGEFPNTLVSFNQYELELDSIPIEIEVGFSVYQGSRRALITAIDRDTNIVTVNKLINGWVLGSIKLVQPITVEIETNPITGDNPGKTKQFIETTLIFNTPDFSELTVGFGTNFDSNYLKTTLANTGTGGYGQTPYGLTPYGGSTKTSIQKRTLYPANRQRGLWSSIQIQSREAFSSFSLVGISVIFSDTSERIK